MTIERSRTERITLTQREWQKLAHARLIGMAWTYGREFTVIDEDAPKPWIATGIYQLPNDAGWVIVRFNREDADHILCVDSATAFTLYFAWRDVNRDTKR